MPGGLLQIRKTEWRTKYLTQNPEITHFKTIYKRHSDFAMESIETKIGDNISDDEINVSISDTRGDLIHKMWLEVDFPEISSTTDATTADVWSANTTYKIGDVVKGTVAQDITQLVSANGNSTLDRFGFSNSMNTDGSVLLVSATYGENSNSIQTGLANIYIYQNGSLTLDVTFYGPSNLCSFGFSTAVNGIGNICAVSSHQHNGLAGFVQPYQKFGNTWYALPTLYGSVANENFGFCIDLDVSGDVLAVSAPYSNINGVISGYVNVYDNFGAGWILRNSPIMGNAMEGSGSAIKLSADGSRIVIGAPIFSSSTGSVKVFEWDGAIWSQVGQNLLGSTTLVYFGESVSINSSGDVIAVGAYAENGTGAVRVYSLISSVWQQIGNTVYGIAAGDRFGEFAIELSGDGTKFSAGSRTHDSNRGYTKIYFWDNTSTTWITKYSTLSGSAVNQTAGFSTLSRDGTKAIVGSPFLSSTTNSGSMALFSVPIIENIETAFTCISAGATDTTEPTWNYSAITDGTAEWENIISFYPARLATHNDLYEFLDFVSIGTQDTDIEKHTGGYLKIWHKLSYDKSEILNHLTIDINRPKTSVYRPITKTRIPLEFWFCREAGNALPLIALEYNNLKLKIKFNNLPNNSAASIWSDYIFVDNIERKRYASAKHEFIINQVQEIQQNITSGINEIRLKNFNHPIKEIIWKLDDVNHDKLENAVILVDNKPLFSKRDAEYFSSVQRYQFHTKSKKNIDDKEIYLYSFDLEPENFSSHGSLNFSRLENPVLKINTKNLITGNITIYARNINILKISKGVANLLYSS
jgi:hypothetical protein